MKCNRGCKQILITKYFNYLFRPYSELTLTCQRSIQEYPHQRSGGTVSASLHLSGTSSGEYKVFNAGWGYDNTIAASYQFCQPGVRISVKVVSQNQELLASNVNTDQVGLLDNTIWDSDKCVYKYFTWIIVLVLYSRVCTSVLVLKTYRHNMC